MSKIFGIGLPRTGTASLSEALTILGYKTRHYPKYIDRARQYDALVDSPVCNCYIELDQKYPNSKFILTTREINRWLSSCKKASKRFKWHSLNPDGRCGPEVYQSHMDLFGSVEYDRDRFIDGYGSHLKKVLNYFEGRDNLLIFEVSDGWNRLCSFLDKEIPVQNFPHRNKSKDTETIAG